MMLRNIDLNRKKKALLFLLLAAWIGLIGVVDIRTGFLPDLTVSYWLPIAIASIYLGWRLTLLTAFLSTLMDLVSNILVSAAFSAVFKITDQLELVVVATTLRLAIFLTGALIMTRFIEQLRILKTIEAQRASDLLSAQNAQRSIIEQPLPSWQSMEYYAHTDFAWEVGGDYYLATDWRGRPFLCVADISGKNVTAALFTALLDRDVRDLLSSELRLESLVESLNARVRRYLPDDMFITILCMVVEDEAVQFVNSGHEPACLLESGGERPRLLTGNPDPPINVLQTLLLTPSSLPFRANDVLIAFSDGVTTSPQFIDDPYEKLGKLLSEHRGDRAEEIANLVHDLAADADQGHLRDDITVICVKKTA